MSAFNPTTNKQPTDPPFTHLINICSNKEAQNGVICARILFDFNLLAKVQIRTKLQQQTKKRSSMK